MKLLHTSDWHLGKMIANRSMLDDQRYFIDNIFFPTITEHSPDAIVLCGDIFDRAIPPTAALELFDDTLTRIADIGIPFIAITGNHDGAKRLSLGSRLMRSAGIHIFTSIESCTESVTISCSDGDTVMIHPLPYFDLSQARDFNGSESGNYQELFVETLNKIDTSDSNAKHILAAHCTVLGSLRCDSESNTMIGGSTEVGAEIFSKFDYTLLGHLHSMQAPAHNVSYCGAPLRYSFDAGERNKSIQLITYNQGKCEILSLPVTSLREMRVISGLFDNLLEAEPSEDYIYAELLDQSLIFEPMARLRQKYPNILGMGYCKNVFNGSDGADRAELTHKLRTRSLGDAEVLDAFFRQMCDDAPNEDDFRLFEKLCGEADNMEVNCGAS